MAVESKLIRVRDKGQITLPADVRERLGLNKGDLVVVVETANGVLLKARGAAVAEALDGMGAALRDAGYSFGDLEELIESGRAERTELLRELYGFNDRD